MSSVFSKIIQGEIPSYFIADNTYCIAFLDINPIQRGHVLIVPKMEIDQFFDLPDNILQQMIVFSKKIASAMKIAIPCNRIGVSVLGLEVPHAHIHLIPINQENDITFGTQKISFSKEEMQDIANSIKSNL